MPTMTKTWPPIWMKGRPNILSAEILSKIKGALERGPVFGYHSIYCGGCSLNTWVFKAFEDLAGYLQSRAQAGDLFTVWSVHQLLERNLHLFSGGYSRAEQAAELTVPPAQLERVKAYLDFVDPKVSPYRNNEIHGLF